MNLLDYFFQKNKRKKHFPLSQENRIIVDKPKHKIDSKAFKKLVNEYLKPQLTEIGFDGDTYNYYRKRNNIYDTILLGTSRYGKAICINVDVKQGVDKMITPTEIMNLQSITNTPIGWKRLSPDNKDCWWWFRPTIDENKQVFEEMFFLIVTEGEKYFSQYP